MGHLRKARQRNKIINVASIPDQTRTNFAGLVKCVFFNSLNLSRNFLLFFNLELGYIPAHRLVVTSLEWKILCSIPRLIKRHQSQCWQRLDTGVTFEKLLNVNAVA